MAKTITLLDLRAADSWPRRCRRGRHLLGVQIGDEFVVPDVVVGDPPMQCRYCTYTRGFFWPRSVAQFLTGGYPSPAPEEYSDDFTEWLDEQLAQDREAK